MNTKKNRALTGHGPEPAAVVEPEPEEESAAAVELAVGADAIGVEEGGGAFVGRITRFVPDDEPGPIAFVEIEGTRPEVGAWFLGHNKGKRAVFPIEAVVVGHSRADYLEKKREIEERLASASSVVGTSEAIS